MAGIKVRGSGLKKQRSIQLDEETWELAGVGERESGLSRSDVIGQLLWANYGPGAVAQPQPAQPEMAAGKIEEARTEAQSNPRGIVLPPDSADNFKVQGRKVKHTKDKPKLGESNVNFDL